MNKLNIEIVSCLQNQGKKPSLEVELYYNYTARGLDSYDVESLISRTHPEWQRQTNKQTNKQTTRPMHKQTWNAESNSDFKFFQP